MKLRSILFCLFFISSFNSHAQTWNKVGAGLKGGVLAFGTYNNTLIVTSSDTVGGNIKTNGTAQWNGADWDSVGSCDNMSIQCFSQPFCYAEYNNELYAGGDFLGKGNAPLSQRIARWDGTHWESAGGSPADGIIHSLAVYKGELYAGGSITQIGGVNVRRIARWDGASWKTVGGVSGGVTGSIEIILTMAVYKDELYVGGEFYAAAGNLAPFIAKWNGSSWTSVGGGMNGTVMTMTVDTINDLLYVGGSFSTVISGSDTLTDILGIAAWNGNKWRKLNKEILYTAYNMEMYNRNLYATTTTHNGNVSDTILAKWDGLNWTRIQGPNETIYDMEVYNNELYIGGGFTMINSDNINGIARYLDTTTSCNFLQANISSSDTVNIYSGDSSMVQFQNNNKYASLWKWNFGDGDSAAIQNPIHYYTSAGTYNVEVIVNYQGCIDTANRVIVVKEAINTAVNDHGKKNSFKIFPNPAKEEITIKIETGINIKKSRIEIYDLSGKMVKEISEIKGNEVKISLTDLGKGVYFVKLLDVEGKEYSSEKVIIQ